MYIARDKKNPTANNIRISDLEPELLKGHFYAGGLILLVNVKEFECIFGWLPQYEECRYVETSVVLGMLFNKVHELKYSKG